MSKRIPLATRFEQWVRELPQASGLSQDALADVSGLDRTRACSELVRDAPS